MCRVFFSVLSIFCILVVLWSPGHAFADTVNGGCPRPAAGGVVVPPPDLFSRNGVLNVALNYFTDLDSAGRTLFCFKTTDGLQSPTLHVKPGDTLNIILTNRVPPLARGSPDETISDASTVCGAMTMTETSVNMHFHGMNVSPTCHADEVVHTIVNSGETFRYSVTFPADEPPGLYWYHPHLHGISEAAIQGGATGAIIVEGIAALQPAVVGLPERLLILRDQNVAGNPTPGGAVPSWDLSVNYIPVAYPAMTPAAIEIKPDQREFWRVANTSADTVTDLQLLFDGVAQPLQVVGEDGVPTGSQDGTRRGKIVTVTHMLVPTGGRVEFILDGPTSRVQHAAFMTRQIQTGPDGDNDPLRTLAVLRTTARPTVTLPVTSSFAAWPGAQRFEGLADVPVTAHRKLYFSEILSDPSNPASPTNFYITVDGAKPVLFDPVNPPAITTTQGAVEEWTIENRSKEVHEFHIHQIHFLLIAQNGLAVSADERQFHDMVQIPSWSGSGPYPSVTVLMDFRGPVVGDFVYHCHILGHEDNGMMAIIRVLPQQVASRSP